MKRKCLVGSWILLTFFLYASIAFAAPVPDTGQTKCFDVSGNEISCPSPGQALYGQDANYTINSMSYTKLDSNGNDLPDSATSWAMVRDNVTNLIWEVKTNKDGVKDYNDPHDADNTYTWYDHNDSYPGTPGDGSDTEDFIKVLNNSRFGGYSDWRVPSIKELVYISNDGIPNLGQTIDSRFFPNIQQGAPYWSSTDYAGTFDGDKKYAWYIYFTYDGNDSFTPKSQSLCVQAVRGGQSQSSYVDNNNGTITDTTTGLMWQQDTPNVMTWEQALSYCESLNLGGYTDWRLPTKKELRSLVDYNYVAPAINPTFFPATPLDFFWSSTSHAYTSHYNADYAFFVDFLSGFDEAFYKQGSIHVRAVRGFQSGASDVSILSVSPTSQSVSADADNTTFSVNNTGTGTMSWTASVTSGNSWLSISSGSSGTNTGTINCSFTANTNSSTRTATIRVTATGAAGSPVDVMVIQDGSGGVVTIVGEESGYVQISLSAKQVVELVINSTNSHGDTPVYEWFLFTATIGGYPLPIYLFSDIGVYDLNQVLTDIYSCTFSFDEDDLTTFASLSMSDMGLQAGDNFVYAYAYQNQSGIMIIDNIVFITVQ